MASPEPGGGRIVAGQHPRGQDHAGADARRQHNNEHSASASLPANKHSFTVVELAAVPAVVESRKIVVARDPCRRPRCERRGGFDLPTMLAVQVDRFRLLAGSVCVRLPKAHTGVDRVLER